ncbi:MAG: hypothetical protein KGI80_01710 [Verrucomicrobiota bacterium]|nr:hypothetical protein [Verrucomicrobiota bacterium]
MAIALSRMPGMRNSKSDGMPLSVPQSLRLEAIDWICSRPASYQEVRSLIVLRAFGQASEIAKMIPNQMERERSLYIIALAMVYSGYKPEQTTVDMMAQRVDLEEKLLVIVNAMLSAKHKVEDVVSIIDRMRDSFIRDLCVQDIVKAMASAGLKPEDILAVACKIQTEHRYDSTLHSAFNVMISDESRLEEALQIAKNMKGESSYLSALGTIAPAMVAAGCAFKRVLAIVEEIEKIKSKNHYKTHYILKDIVLAMISQKYELQEIKKLTNKIRHMYRAEGDHGIAKAMLSAGYGLDQVLEIVNKIPCVDARNAVLADIAPVLVSAGHGLEKALAILDRIPKEDRNFALQGIAAAMISAGFTVGEASAIVDGIAPSRRDSAWGEIVFAMINKGYAPQEIETIAHRIQGEEPIRSYAWMSIIPTMISAHCEVEEIRAVLARVNKTVRVLALKESALGMLSAGYALDHILLLITNEAIGGVRCDILEHLAFEMAKHHKPEEILVVLNMMQGSLEGVVPKIAIAMARAERSQKEILTMLTL